MRFVSFNSGIPYNDFHINVIKSNGEVGKLETLLRSSVKTTKTFFDDNKSSPDIKTAELKNIIDSAVAALPIIEKALSKENDWMEPMIKAISPEKRLLIKSNLENVGHDLQQILASTKQLSLSKNIDEKNEVEKLKDFSNVAIVQDKLKSIVARFSSGNSLFREYPALAVGPLLGISILIALFTPIRDTIYQNKADDSIISCQLSETLQDYFPLVLHWRLKNVHSINNNPAWEMLNSVIYAIAYNPGTYLPGGGAMHYERHNESDVRCNRNDCNESSDGVCFKDKLQDNAAYAGYKGEPSHNCLVDYLFLVRLRVQELFDTAIGFSNITCSDAMRNRHRQPTGYGWWTFTRLTYWAYGDLNGEKCDKGISQQNENCDVYIKIFINNKLNYQTEKHENQHHGTYTFNYRSPKTSKKSLIRFEMWDDDTGFLGTDDDLLLNKTFTIDELTKQNRIDIKAGTKKSIDTSIRLEGSAWKNENYSL